MRGTLHFLAERYDVPTGERLVKARGGVDMGDHPPIVPCRLYRGAGGIEGSMTSSHAIFVATVSPDAMYERTRVNVSYGDEVFKNVWETLVDPGFLAVLQPAVAQAALEEHQENIASGAPPPKEKYKVGDVLKGESTRLVIVEGKTQPPTHLTESSLITMMEKNGIGTDASIPTHIENIVKRKYVSLAPGRKLVPTALGIVLIKGYLRVDPDLVQPRARSYREPMRSHCPRPCKSMMS